MKISGWLSIAVALLYSASAAYAGQVPNPANITGTPNSGDIMVSGGGQNITSGGGNASSLSVTATGGTTAITLGNRAGNVINAKDNGAISDVATSQQTVTIGNGSKSLSTAAPFFASTDCPVGGTGCTGNANYKRWVVIPGAFTTATTGPVISAPVTAPGSGYTSAPTCSVNDSGGSPGSGATCTVAMQLQSATVATGGSGCTNGTQDFLLITGSTTTGTVTGGTGTIPHVSGTVSGGVLTGALTVSKSGFMTALPATLTGATIYGAGCTVYPTINASYGVGVIQVTNFGTAYNQATTSVSLSGGSPSVAATVGTPTVYLSSLPLVTYITGFTDSQHVTVNDAATNAVSAVAENVMIGTDNSAVLQAAINAANSAHLPLYIPGGVYFTSVPLDPGNGPLSIRGDGLEATVLVYRGGTVPGGIQTGSFYPAFQNITGSPTALKGVLQFEDMQFRGLFDFGLMNVGAQAVFLDNYTETSFSRVKFFNTNFMGIDNHNNYRFRVTDSELINLARDGLRCISCFNVLINHTHFQHGADNSIALHQATATGTIGTIRDSLIVTDNELEDSGGISILGGRVVTVTGNVCKREQSLCVRITRDSNEGPFPMFGLTVANNTATDTLSFPPFTPVPAPFIIEGQIPTTPPAEPNFIPGVNYKGNNYIAPLWDYNNVNSNSATDPMPPGYGVTIKGNQVFRILPDVGNYSAWGYGKTFTVYGFIDIPAFGVALQPGAGLLMSLNAVSQTISDNNFMNTRRCISLIDTGYAAASHINFVNNSCYDNWEYGILQTGSTTAGTWLMVNNRFTLDPYRISNTRSGGAGGWVSGTSASRAISTSASPYIFGCGNVFAEMYAVGNGTNPFSAGCPNIILGNMSTALNGSSSTIGVWDANNVGLGTYPAAGSLFQIQDSVANPSITGNATYYSRNTAHIVESQTIPNTGRYFQGDFVRATGIGVINCNCYGWVRLTTGINHVLGTDWAIAPMQMGGTQFTISGCSTSAAVGGATAGQFASGTTGTCTVTITMNGATGLTAANGFFCRANDLTTPADLIVQTASSTTTATLSGTTASGDTINFSCTAY